jgi:repressor LexA
MKEPTRQKILQAVRQLTAQHGVAPTLTELAEAVDIRSRSNVLFHLRKLEAEGLIARTPQTHRGITLVTPPPAFNPALMEGDFQIPLRGIVAAGKPVEAILTDELVSIPRDLLLSTTRDRAFALRVRGDSMIDEHICDGDLLIVKAQQTAHNGQKVIALIDGTEATVKKIFFDPGAVRLEPANPLFQPIIVQPPHTLQIQGIVIASLRRYE